MGLIKKDVQIELRTVIDDQGHKEMSIVKQTGKYTATEDREVLVFKEQTEVGDIRNFITLQDGKFTLKRSGAVSMNQRLIQGQETVCIYRHPYGNILMDAKTIAMSYVRLTDYTPGVMNIEYEVTLNGEQTRMHHLTLTYEGA